VIAGDVRVLDLGRYVAAPYCSLMLADLGAEVIRAERPGGGEDRGLGLCGAHGDTFTFSSLARNKKGVTLDLRRGDAARDLLRALVARCDVVLHNFGPAAAAALGVTYDDVRAVREDVVYAAISSYGARGPDADRTGFDPIVQMSSGAAAVTGEEGADPIRAGVPWVDYATGLAAAAGILAALRHRDRTGEGQAVDCALLQTAVSFTAPIVAEAVAAKRTRPRLGNQPAYIGLSNLFACRDGRVYVTAVSRSMWRALAGVIGSPELADDPRLRTPLQRYEARAWLDPIVAAWASERTVAEVVAALQVARVPCGAYLRCGEVLDHPQVRANDMLPCLDLEVDGLDRVPASATPFSLSRVQRPPAVRPPCPGEHNGEVYGGLLGLDRERLGELERAGVI
jgi:formyl-CoA transferase